MKSHLESAYDKLFYAAQAYWEDYYERHDPESRRTADLHKDLEDALYTVGVSRSLRSEFRVVNQPRTDRMLSDEFWTVERHYIYRGIVDKYPIGSHNMEDMQRLADLLNSIYNGGSR